MSASSSVFSHAERSKVSWGTRRRRLTADSAVEKDACAVCLAPAEEPVVCPRGHLMCRECGVAALLSQKQAARDRQQEAEEAAAEARGRDEAAREARQQRDARAFAARQDGTAAAEAAAAKAAPALGSFWVPSLTPAAADASGPAAEAQAAAARRKRRRATVCPGDGEPHALRLKQLRRVCFTPNEAAGAAASSSSAPAARHMCPSCKKAFRGVTKVDVLLRCGHAFCRACSALCVADKVCSCCGDPCDAEKVTPLRTGGSSFASGGARVATSKLTPAFQG